MRQVITQRAQRLFGRLPRPTPHSALELLLLALIAIQAARFFWVLVTPLGADRRLAAAERCSPRRRRPRASAISIPSSASTMARPGGGHRAQPQALRRARGPRDRARFGDHRSARRHAAELRGRRRDHAGRDVSPRSASTM